MYIKTSLKYIIAKKNAEYIKAKEIYMQKSLKELKKSTTVYLTSPLYHSVF